MYVMNFDKAGIHAFKFILQKQRKKRMKIAVLENFSLFHVLVKV